MLVFFLMIGLMVVLNGNQETSKAEKGNNTETVISANLDQNGLTPLLSQLPGRTEGALPIKLISNPFSNFLVFVNHAQEFKNTFHFFQRKWEYLNFCTQLPTNFLIKYISTSRNKGHR